MIDFSNVSVFKLKKTDASKFDSEMRDILIEDEKIIGCIGYYDHNESNIGIAEGEAEVGYWIGKPFWNQGYCTEALREMIEYCVCQNFANHQNFTMFASSNKPNSPGETIHQTYPTAVKGHYGGIVSRPV